jgi:hypothetical protein
MRISSARKSKRELTPDLLELAIAWLRGEIYDKQAAAALYGDNYRSGNQLYVLARALREAYRQGRIREAA